MKCERRWIFTCIQIHSRSHTHYIGLIQCANKKLLNKTANKPDWLANSSLLMNQTLQKPACNVLRWLRIILFSNTSNERTNERRMNMNTVYWLLCLMSQQCIWLNRPYHAVVVVVVVVVVIIAVVVVSVNNRTPQATQNRGKILVNYQYTCNAVLAWMFSCCVAFLWMSEEVSWYSTIAHWTRSFGWCLLVVFHNLELEISFYCYIHEVALSSHSFKKTEIWKVLKKFVTKINHFIGKLKIVIFWFSLSSSLSSHSSRNDSII